MAGKIHRNSLKPGYRLHWYEIREVLGQGGFGITYLAIDNNLHRKVAIKEYLPIELAVREGDFSVHPLTDERGVQYCWGLERFITEARTLARFEHPNIVRVHAVFEENNTGYMVMACEEGQSLQQLLAGKQTMEEGALMKILIPILGGLELVHQAGFIHRDIKPDNIFIRRDGSPVLLDFGSARQALGEQTKTLTSLVTPGYAPFEQYYSKSDEQGPWTDIYGLGATLYRAIAGVPPMDAVDRSKAILDGRHELFVAATELGKGRYSERFLRAIDHALMFRKQDRPQTVDAWKREFGIADDLAEIRRIRDQEAQPTQPGTKLSRPPGKRIRPVTALLFILLAVSVLGYFQRDRFATLLPDIPVKPAAPIEPVAGVVKEQEPLQGQQVEAERQKQEEITRLLVQAETAYTAGDYLEPPGNNALEHYLNVLALDPDNAAARQGKERIFGRFIEMAASLMKEQRFEEAQRALLKAEVIEPDSRNVRLARIRLEEEKAEAGRIAHEKEEERLAEERRRQAEEEKRLAELERQKQEEEQKRLLEQQRLEEEKKRLAEQQRLEEEKKRLAEQQRMEAERKQQFAAFLTEADQAARDRNRELALAKYNAALAIYPGDVTANLALKEAEKIKHKLCYEVTGTWVWDKAFGKDTMVLNDDGTIDYQTIVKGSGSWECTNPEGRIIRIRLSAGGFSNEWLSEYSTDGKCLTGPQSLGGKSCYRRPEAGEDKESRAGHINGGFCREIVGKWSWEGWGAATILKDDGSYNIEGGISGNWECSNPGNRTITMIEGGQPVEMTLSEDGKCLKRSHLFGSGCYVRLN